MSKAKKEKLPPDPEAEEDPSASEGEAPADSTPRAKVRIED